VEEQALQVRDGLGRPGVDDGEVGVRIGLCDLLDGALHQEADRDHELVAVQSRVLQVGDVVRAVGGLKHVALDAELRLGLQQALVRQVVEAAVVEAADVGDQADGDLGRRRARR